MSAPKRCRNDTYGVNSRGLCPLDTSRFRNADHMLVRIHIIDFAPISIICSHDRWAQSYCAHPTMRQVSQEKRRLKVANSAAPYRPDQPIPC